MIYLSQGYLESILPYELLLNHLILDVQNTNVFSSLFLIALRIGN